jgi:hypothetical protein
MGDVSLPQRPARVEARDGTRALAAAMAASDRPPRSACGRNRECTRDVPPPTVGNGPTTPVPVSSSNINTRTTSRRNRKGCKKKLRDLSAGYVLSVYNWRIRSASGVPGAELAALSGTRQVFGDGAMMMIALQYTAAYRAAPIPDVVADALTWRRFRHRSAFTDSGIHRRARCRACRSNGIFSPQRTSRYYFSQFAVYDDRKSLPPSKNVCSRVGRLLFSPPLDCEMAGFKESPPYHVYSRSIGR